MKSLQAVWKPSQGWTYLSHSKQELNAPLVFVFGNRFLLESTDTLQAIQEEFPYQHIVYGSTSGEIAKGMVYENTVTVTAIEFEKSSFRIVTANVLNFNKDANATAITALKNLPKEGLKHVFVLSEGSFVNGSALIQGIEQALNHKVTVTGGMCGDDARFQKTLASYQKAPTEGEVVLIGLYGQTLEITFASCGGWIPFGPERVVTKSNNNVLYELDDQPAVDLYSKYLGDKAKELTKSSLFYPLNVMPPDATKPVIRTILNVDEEQNSMVLAGDIPHNATAQLMMASSDGIVEGAAQAAKYAMQERVSKPQLAILVSCVGRKLVLDQRCEEEVEEVLAHIGNNALVTGFYSYGEMAPFHKEQKCQLHNQTMTLTLISE